MSATLTYPVPLGSMVRKADPITSFESAISFSAERLTDIQKDVYHFFLAQPNYSATDEELEDALKVRHPAFSTLRKRRTDLARLGVIRDSGLKVTNRNGRKMIVWEIAPMFRPNQ